LHGEPDTDLSGVLAFNEPAVATPATGDLRFEGSGGAGGAATGVPSSSIYNTCTKRCNILKDITTTTTTTTV